MKPYNSRVIVIAPGTPRPLCDHPFVVKEVTIAALATNTRAIHVGGSGVRARDGEANGLPVLNGQRPDMWTWHDVDLSQVWIDAIIAEEGVSILAWL